MSVTKAYIQLHIAVVLLAGTAILGDLISLSAGVLVWWRTLIAGIGILVFLLARKRLRPDWIRHKRKFYLLGALVGIHWICFFGSIKLANASTALICFATITFFTAFLEPWITGRKRETHEVVFGLLVVPGILLIAGKAEGALLTGIFLGIVAALLVAILSSYEKKWITEIDAEHLTLMQMIGAWVTMCVWLAILHFAGIDNPFWPRPLDWLYLVILSLVCTSIAWVQAARAILTVTAFDSLMVINLEPVYGILMALVLLDDRKELSTQFYIGASIILVTVILHPIWQKRHARISHTPLRG